jgi:NCS1 family nucleobase:cation symporter-1
VKNRFQNSPFKCNLQRYNVGTKYGVPFPVLARSAFGIWGAHVPGVMRALVGCGWFGIRTHVGGQAIYAIIRSAAGSAAGDATAAAAIPFLGISVPELVCYGGPLQVESG